MRCAVRIITLTLILSTALLTGCGEKDTEPTRANTNVKEDARIKADVEQTIKKSVQPAVQAK